MSSRQTLFKRGRLVNLVMLSALALPWSAQASNMLEQAMMAPPGPYISSRQWIMPQHTMAYGYAKPGHGFYSTGPSQPNIFRPEVPMAPMQAPAYVPFSSEGWRW